MATAKNMRKGESYRFAFGRINAAIEQGFYLEAITLSESIIADRLLSYCTWADQRRIGTRTSLSTLIAAWRRLATNGPIWKDEDLGNAVDAWREARNACVHGAAKSEPGSPTTPTAEYTDTAKRTANEGKRLARSVCDWHRAEIAACGSQPKPSANA